MGTVMGPVHGVPACGDPGTDQGACEAGHALSLSLSGHMDVGEAEAGAGKRGARLFFCFFFLIFSEGNFSDCRREVYSPDPH